MAGAKLKLRVKAPTGERLHVQVVGRGPTVIFCTGVGATLSYWKYLEAQLRDRYRLVFWDYRGHGRSEWPKDPATCDVEHLIADLDAVRRAVRARQVALVGFSFGVGLILAYWNRHRARVSALLPMFGAHERPMDNFFVPFMPQLFPWVYKAATERQLPFRLVWSLMQSNPMRISFHVGRLLRIIHPERASWKDMRGYFDHYRVLDVDSFMEMARSMQDLKVSQFLGEIDIPTLVVAGGRDVFTPPAAAHALTAAIPGARCLELPEAGHAGLIEFPKEIGAAVGPFLDAALGGK